ncbi:hypothetical protein [Streptomyces flavidovirens]
MAAAPLTNISLVAVLLGLIEYLKLRVVDLEDQVDAARANVEREQAEHQATRLKQQRRAV